MTVRLGTVDAVPVRHGPESRLSPGWRKNYSRVRDTPRKGRGAWTMAPILAHTLHIPHDATNPTHPPRQIIVTNPNSDDHLRALSRHCLTRANSPSRKHVAM